MKEITNDQIFFFFQILLSASVGPILLYLTLGCWVYPMKDYIGETGCHMRAFLVKALGFSVQLQSFFTSIFRYICVFHNISIRNLNLSPYVSILAVMILFSIIQKKLDFRNCDLERFFKRYGVFDNFRVPYFPILGMKMFTWVHNGCTTQSLV